MALSAGSATLVAGVGLGPPSQETAWSLLPFVVVGPALFVGVTRSHLTDASTLVVPVASHLTMAITFVAGFGGVSPRCWSTARPTRRPCPCSDSSLRCSPRRTT